MQRLCERPGCSDPASGAYGIRVDELVFWLDVLKGRGSSESGVMCRRHADSVIVPSGWTLVDLRDPELHLFRPLYDDSRSILQKRHRQPTRGGRLEQFVIGVIDAETTNRHPSEAASDNPAYASHHTSKAPSKDSDDVSSWIAEFDIDDDLDGLLNASSPLLSRAFGGPRPS